jgi:GcrA cell cycle regulator
MSTAKRIWDAASELHPSHGWNEARTAEVSRRWIAGESASHISKALGGVSRNSVIGKVHRLGLASSGRAKATDPSTRSRALNKTPKSPKPKRMLTPAPVTKRPDLTPVTVRVSSNGRSVYTLPPSEPLRPTQTVNTGVEPKPLLERGFGECCWPVSGEGADTLFCSAPVSKANWCSQHARIGFQPANGWYSDKAGGQPDGC